MGTFDVEPEVGTIFVAQPLDYEMEQRYELRLVASDGKWENETLVVVQVVNRNDEAPVFSQTEYHAAVTEELTQLPVFILEVSATDFNFMKCSALFSHFYQCTLGCSPSVTLHSLCICRKWMNGWVDRMVDNFLLLS